MTLYENITLADLQAAQTAGTLKTGVIYRIVSGSNNFTTGGELFEVQAISATQLANTGTGIFQNCDWQNIGDYSDVAALTGIAKSGTAVAMWQSIKGTIDYAPQVQTYFHNLSGINFAPTNTLTGGTNGGTAEILSLLTTIIVTIPDTSGMAPADVFVIKDAATNVLQTGAINAVIDGTHLLVDSLSGGYFDASQLFDNYDNTTQNIQGVISDIQYGMNIKVTSGDWATEASFTNDVAPNDTADTLTISYSAFAIGNTVTDGNTGATGLIVSDTGNGTSFGTLTLRLITDVFAASDTLTNGSGATAFQVGAITYTYNPAQGDIVIGWGGANSNYWGHYQKITITDIFVDPVTDAGTNYTFLPRDGSKYGYIEEVDEITYEVSNDLLLERVDPHLFISVQNNVCQLFPFGWNNIRLFTQAGSATSFIIKNPAYFSTRVSLGEGCTFIVNESNSNITNSIIADLTIIQNNDAIVVGNCEQGVFVTNNGNVASCNFSSAASVNNNKQLLDSDFRHACFVNGNKVITSSNFGNACNVINNGNITSSDFAPSADVENCGNILRSNFKQTFISPP